LSSTYTGNAGNIGALTPVTATIPADGDTRVVASVNVALQKLTDYIAYLETQLSPAVVPFGANGVPSTASTEYWMWLAGLGGTGAPGTASASGRTRFNSMAAGRVVGFSYGFSGTTAGGLIVVGVRKSGGAATTAATITAGTAAGQSGGTLNISFTSNDYLEVTIANGSGVSAGVGNIAVTLFISLG
jgi:hypothetical protein